MIKKTVKQFLTAVINYIKKAVSNPVNYVYIIIGGMVLVILLGFKGAKEIDEYIEENLTEQINFKSDGCGNIYVRDGIIVSFETVYMENSLIALQVKMENTVGKETAVKASIEAIGEETSFTSDKDHAEYLIIGDFQYTSYDVTVSISQGERVLAEGTVYITPSANNGTVFNEKETVYFKPDMEIYYLGNHEDVMFMIFDNKTPMDLNVTFSNEESEFSLTTPKQTYQYIYISNMGTVRMDVEAFDITIREVSEEDITIEKVDGTEQEGGF